MITRQKVDEARAELLQKSPAQIERETALAWGARAAAAYEYAAETGKLDWLFWAEELYHEALEHAALADDAGETARMLTGALAQWRKLGKSIALSPVL